MSQLNRPHAKGSKRPVVSKSCSRRRIPSVDDGKFVLIVEDNDLVKEVLADIVSAFGLQVYLAENGARALSIIESRSESICCVILDYDIPGAHSSRVASKVRECAKHAKIVLSSGYPKSHIEEHFPLEIVDEFLAKPCEPAQLISKLKELVLD